MCLHCHKTKQSDDAHIRHYRFSKWANYLDLRLEFDEDDELDTRLYDKRDDFDFPVVNFPYLRHSGIPCIKCLLSVHKFDTSVSHMLKGLFTNCDT